MRAGDLTDVVRWHKRVVEEQRSGAVKESYDDFGELRCKVKEPTGLAKVSGDRVVIDDTTKVYVRRHYNVKEFDRIIVDGVVYYVDYVANHRRAGMKVLTIKRELL